jgi:hypothetical protein
MSIQFCISEHEAFGKLCCLPNAGADVVRQGHCAGSKCMAWRWVETNIFDGEGGTESSNNTHGYCGLAGPTEIMRHD